MAKYKPFASLTKSTYLTNMPRLKALSTMSTIASPAISIKPKQKLLTIKPKSKLLWRALNQMLPTVTPRCRSHLRIGLDCLARLSLPSECPVYTASLPQAMRWQAQPLDLVGLENL